MQSVMMPRGAGLWSLRARTGETLIDDETYTVCANIQAALAGTDVGQTEAREVADRIRATRGLHG